MSDGENSAEKANDAMDSQPADDLSNPTWKTQVIESVERITTRVKRPPLTLSQDRSNREYVFDPASQALVQLLPSGTCLPLAPYRVSVLGRTAPSFPGVGENEDLIDLNPFQAYQHGVSRRHAILKRQDEKLVVVDLGAANGTYLNGERLQPYQEYSVAHGDELILGTLRMRLTFSQTGPLEDSSSATQQ